MTNINSKQGDFTIEQAMCGNRYDGMYDPLRAMTVRPDLRKDAIMNYSSSSIEGLFSQIGYLLGNDKRRTTTREFYTQEISEEGGLSFVVRKSLAAVPAAGANVTLTIDAASHSATGTMSLPSAGFMVYLNGNAGKSFNVISVNPSVSGAHTITLQPLNGTVADFTTKDRYTLTSSRMKRIGVCTDDCITGNNFVMSPPVLRKHYVQKYERGYAVKEDEFNNYAYTEHAHEVTFTDSYGKVRTEWAEGLYTDRLMNDIKTNRVLETLFAERDDVNKLGFNGVLTTASKNSFLNQVYDTAQGATFSQIFMNLIRRIRNSRGSNEYLLCHDFHFGLDWDAGLTELARSFTGTNQYSILGPGATGERDMIWPEFGFFKYNNYKFGKYQIDMFDDPKFGGNMRENYAFMLPMARYKDTAGKTVAPVTYVTMQGAEVGPDMQIYTVDKRKTMACREVLFVGKDTFGLEIHCADKLGLMYKATC